MKIIKDSWPFSAFGVVFLSSGVIFADPKQFSFGIVWLLIAAAKTVLISKKEKSKDPVKDR